PMVEGDTAIAGCGQESDALESLFALLANAMKQGDGRSGTATCHHPAYQTNGIRGAAFQRLPGQAEVAGGPCRRAEGGPGQPARDRPGCRYVADPGGHRQARQPFGHPGWFLGRFGHEPSPPGPSLRSFSAWSWIGRQEEPIEQIGGRTRDGQASPAVPPDQFLQFTPMGQEPQTEALPAGAEQGAETEVVIDDAD